MFEAGDIREWRGHGVVDSSGHKIGTLESVYVDTGTDQPAFAAVTVRLPTRHRLVFLPLPRAPAGPPRLQVTPPERPADEAPPNRTPGEPPARGPKATVQHPRPDSPPR